MITEDYVSFETAKLLKEKGFDVPCFAYYYVMPHKTVIAYDKDFPKNSDLCLIYANMEFGSMPTLQMAMKWLREIYKIEARSTYDYEKDSWWGNINPMFEETDENSDIYQKAFGFDYQGKSYEEACEAAIKYCLENLIGNEN